MWFYHVSFVVITCIFFALSFFLGLHVLYHFLMQLSSSLSSHLLSSPSFSFFFWTLLYNFSFAFMFFFPHLLSFLPFIFLPLSNFPLLSSLLSSPLPSSPIFLSFPFVLSSTLFFFSSPSLLSFPLLSSPFHHVYFVSSPQACEIPETAVFSLAPPEESSLAKPCSVPCWDLLQTSVQGKVEFPLPLRHMLFSLFPRPDSGVGSAPWSLPAPIRPDFPRQSLSVPGDPDSGGGLSSRWVKQSICGLLAVTVHLV